MSEQGFIKIDRKITGWQWYTNPIALSLWIHLLVEANWEDRWWKSGQELVKRGELITSQAKLAKNLGVDRKTIRKYLKLFENAGQIACDMDNQKTKITVIKYGFYQDSNMGLPIGSGQLPGQLRPTTEEVKEVKEVKEEREGKIPTLSQVISFVKENGMSFDAQKFFDYYEERNWKGIKDWRKKAREWERSEHRWSNSTPKKKDVLPDYLESEKKLEAFKKKLKEERKQ